MTIRQMILFAIAFFVCGTAQAADVAFSPLFTDNMVLQRGVRVPVYGTANRGESVVVTFASQKASAVADAGGQSTWSERPISTYCVLMPVLKDVQEPNIRLLSCNRAIFSDTPRDTPIINQSMASSADAKSGPLARSHQPSITKGSL